jgi:hypothetical protein
VGITPSQKVLCIYIASHTSHLYTKETCLPLPSSYLGTLASFTTSGSNLNEIRNATCFLQSTSTCSLETLKSEDGDTRSIYKCTRVMCFELKFLNLV